MNSTRLVISIRNRLYVIDMIHLSVTNTVSPKSPSHFTDVQPAAVSRFVGVHGQASAVFLFGWLFFLVLDFFFFFLCGGFVFVFLAGFFFFFFFAALIILFFFFFLKNS